MCPETPWIAPLDQAWAWMSQQTSPMARYVTSVRSPKHPEEAFAYMADLRNFAEWDPGVVAVDQRIGDGGGPDAEFAVKVKAVPGPMTLVYQTLDHQEPHRVLVRADSPMLASVDEITVTPADGGCIVTYDAELTLKGLLRAFDPGLGLVFGRIGDRAAAGLRTALAGVEVTP